MTKLLTLGKNERLKSRKLIARMFSEGKNFYSQPYKIYYLFADEIPGTNRSAFPLQFAVSIPTKKFKKAVDRNKLKRLTREAYRLQKKELHEGVHLKRLSLYLFFIYADTELSDFDTIKTKVGIALHKILQRINHDHPENT